MRVRRVTRARCSRTTARAGPRLRRRAKGIAIEAGGVRGAHRCLSRWCSRPRRSSTSCCGCVRRKPWMAVRLVCMAWWFLFGELRGIAGLAAIYLVTGGPLGRRLAAAPAAGLRPAHPLGAQPPGGRARAVRPDVRDRGPREGGAGAGARPDPAREHHRQRAPRRRDRPRARARPALRAQARAADDPHDRHRRPLGAHELRAPRVRPTRRERWRACGASRTISARARASSSTRRARATPPRSSPARRS